MGTLPQNQSRPDLEFVGDAPRSSDKAYSADAQAALKSVADRVANTVKEKQGK